MRIGFYGSSGSGKTTMAEWVAREYQIPFITTSSKVLWGRYNIKSHEQIIRLTNNDPLGFGLSFQKSLLNYRADVLTGLSEYVTDRTTIDNWVYFSLQLIPFIPEKQIDEYYLECRSQLHSYYDLVIFTRPLDNLEHDGKRIASSAYQQLTDYIFQSPGVDMMVEADDDDGRIAWMELKNPNLRKRKLSIMQYIDEKFKR